MDQKRKIKKKIPRPVALADTFFNRNLLQPKPFDLRDEIFLGHTKEDGWIMVENLLCAIEHGAELALKDKARLEDPLGVPYGEKDLHDKYGCAKLPEDQANAIAALRSIQLIRKEFRFRKVHEHYILDGVERGVDQTYDSRTVAKLMLETALLIMAAFRGDFVERYWPRIVAAVRAEAGANAPKRNDLKEEVLRIIERHGLHVKTRAIWDELKGLTKDGSRHPTIVKFEDQKLYWRNNGKNRDFTYNNFKKRISEWKNEIREKNRTV